MSPMIMALDQWQRFDPHADAVWAGADSSGTPRPEIPLNPISVIRSAISDRIVNPIDNVTLDVIGLLFDYIFKPVDTGVDAWNFRQAAGADGEGCIAGSQILLGQVPSREAAARRSCRCGRRCQSDSDYLVAFEAIASAVVAESVTSSSPIPRCSRRRTPSCRR